jgi:hypothetical protein
MTMPQMPAPVDNRIRISVMGAYPNVEPPP